MPIGTGDSIKLPRSDKHGTNTVRDRIPKFAIPINSSGTADVSTYGAMI